MRLVTYYIDRKTGEHKTYHEVYDNNRARFNSYDEYEKWVEENYEEREKFVESPQERLRASVYATGNRWAIENFNATH